MSIASKEPDWSQFDIPHLTELPTIRWKPQNLAQLAKPIRENSGLKLRLWNKP